MNTELHWTFPLRRTHTGIPLGNGRTGLLVWGEGNRLRITIGRADLWDHRGGMPWTERQNYRDIRAALEAGDEAAIRALFQPAHDAPAETPARPTVLPFGRMELELADGCRLTDGVLSITDATVAVHYARGQASGSLQILLHPERDIALIRQTADVARIVPVTSWDLMREKLERVGHGAPRQFTSEGLSGWFWPLPTDPGAYAAWTPVDDGLALAVGRAGDYEEAQREARASLTRCEPSEVEEETIGWWRRYWRSVSRVNLPNTTLQEIHDYGLYLFAGLTNPGGVAATLQGPWIEEYDFPPWSSDYHFNINVQMCYSPAFRSGGFDHLRPLFDLVWSWRDSLRANARNFLGIDDGYMLPHAVDDRATCMGTFWTGTIDHACTAWVAQMMYDYADLAGNVEFLKDVALPFMRGTFAVYRAMMEDNGAQLRLPVTVSPEYRGSRMDAWGANASFQLAAVHRLCENLLAATDAVGAEPDPRWRDVLSRLPAANVEGEPGNERIALWEGVDLEESHRHHSHLAGITPFDTIDPFDEVWRPVAERSLKHWISSGMGMWSGWCMSWASQLHSRVGNGEGAELLLELWRRVFTNEGRGSMHDAVMNGVTLMGAPPLLPQASADHAAAEGDDAGGSSRKSTTGDILARAERMQLDGAMGGVAAVQEMLLHSRRELVCVFPALPRSWQAASFERMRAPGGFEISGWFDRTKGWRVEVRATRAGQIRLLPPSGAYEWESAEQSGTGAGELALTMGAGDQATIGSLR